MIFLYLLLIELNIGILTYSQTRNPCDKTQSEYGSVFTVETPLSVQRLVRFWASASEIESCSDVQYQHYDEHHQVQHQVYTRHVLPAWLSVVQSVQVRADDVVVEELPLEVGHGEARHYTQDQAEGPHQQAVYERLLLTQSVDLVEVLCVDEAVHGDEEEEAHPCLGGHHVNDSTALTQYTIMLTAIFTKCHDEKETKTDSNQEVSGRQAGGKQRVNWVPSPSQKLPDKNHPVARKDEKWCCEGKITNSIHRLLVYASEPLLL